MWKRVVVLLAAAAGLLACAVPAPARITEDWPYDKLLKHAELAVFAVATKTEAADDKPPEHSWNYELVAQNTTLKVKHALKGKAEGAEFKVLHFKLGELKKGKRPGTGDTILEDGPQLVAFRNSGVLVKAQGDDNLTVLTTPEYLLFLKRMADGRYEPVSGRIDPALSVREVSVPLDKVLGGR